MFTFSLRGAPAVVQVAWKKHIQLMQLMCIYIYRDIELSSNGGTPKSSKVRPFYYWNLWFWGSPSLRTPPYIYIRIYIYNWLVVWNIFYFSIYWEESSHLTFIFFRGVQTTNQIIIQRISGTFSGEPKDPHLLAQACFLGLRQLGESQAPATKSGLPIGVHGKNLGKQWEHRKSTRP